MSTKNLWVAVIAVLVVIVALIAYVHAVNKEPVWESELMTPSHTPATGNAAVGASGESQIISYTNNGFSPKEITVAEGTTVTWVNQSSNPMWIASDSHPSHTGYDGTSREQHCVQNAPDSPTVFDECTSIGNGGSYSFTVTNVGTWKYHNHTRATDEGMVIVISP